MYVYAINVFFLEKHISAVIVGKSRPVLINLYTAANKHNLWLKHFFSRVETQALIIEASWAYSDSLKSSAFSFCELDFYMNAKILHSSSVADLCTCSYLFSGDWKSVARICPFCIHSDNTWNHYFHSFLTRFASIIL